MSRPDGTSGPGNVSVDEPTQSSLDPSRDAEEWREPADETGDQDVRNVGADRVSGHGAAGEDDADAATS